MLQRAFSLMEAFGSDGASVGLAELARRAGLPKATAYRLANQLIDLHVLERAGQEYQLGLKLFELGNSVLTFSSLSAKEDRILKLVIGLMEVNSWIDQNSCPSGLTMA